MIDADPPNTRPRLQRSWTELLPHKGPVEGRRFHDGSDVWSVVEITREYLERIGLAPSALAAELQNGWLSFESDTDRRRYAPIPSGWKTMLPDELSALCARAIPVLPSAAP